MILRHSGQAQREPESRLDSRFRGNDEARDTAYGFQVPPAQEVFGLLESHSEEIVHASVEWRLRNFSVR